MKTREDKMLKEASKKHEAVLEEMKTNYNIEIKMA
jgi:hypothetical protein